MAKVVVLGAGIAGHTAAMILRRKLQKEHEVVVVSPNSKYQWIPSNIWVGIGQMTRENVTFELAGVYQKKGIIYKQAKAVSIHPEGNTNYPSPFVSIEYVSPGNKGVQETEGYDYLINATGPKLNFEATEGLGPKGYTDSVCSYTHAEQSWKNFQKVLKNMEKGNRQKIVVGTGHPGATCQGAAFEYILNVAFEVYKRKLEDYAEITWITNEYEVGDFGMGGAFVDRGGYITSTKIFTESVLAEYGIKWIKRAGIYKVDENTIYYETLDGDYTSINYDFAMLIPGFTGVGLKAYDIAHRDITEMLFASNGFMKVDADYTSKPFEQWSVEDWPSTYQNPEYKNIFAPGIAFAPPHAISKPMTSKNGTNITPTPPRTGMPSGVMGKIVAKNIINLIKRKDYSLRHRASMGKMGAVCIISQGYGIKHGAGSTMTVFPIVPDFEKYPMWGRDVKYTVGETGLAGHWIKLLLHVMFLYKAKGKPFWWLIPE